VPEIISCESRYEAMPSRKTPETNRPIPTSDSKHASAKTSSSALCALDRVDSPPIDVRTERSMGFLLHIYRMCANLDFDYYNADSEILACLTLLLLKRAISWRKSKVCVKTVQPRCSDKSVCTYLHWHNACRSLPLKKSAASYRLCLVGLRRMKS
jgi:hypothetical protein